MLNAFFIIDNFQFEKIFEKLARWMQKTTGATCFNLAEWAFKFSWLSSLAVTAYIIYQLSDGFAILAVVLVAFEIDLSRMRYGRIKLVKIMDEVFASGEINGMNKLRLTMLPARVLNMILNPLLFVFYAYVGMPKLVLLYVALYLLCEYSGIYLMACTPMPPCKGTIREWLGSFGRQMQTAKATS